MTGDLEKAGFVVSSSYRRDVMDRLDESPATPSVVAEDIDVSIQHTSRALRELRSEDLVDLLVDEDRVKGRIYGITDRGKTVLETIEENGL